jgi:hypothetical protein
VYTEHQDIEWEHNGMMDYDREPKFYGYEDLFPGFSLTSIHSLDFVAIDCPPCPTLPLGGEFSADVYMSHYSRKEVSRGVLKWRLDGTDEYGAKKVYLSGSKPITFSQYSVAKVHTLNLKLPDDRSVATLALWVESPDNEVLARNYVNIDVYRDSPPRREFPDDKTCILRFDPGDYVDSEWQEDWPRQYAEKASGLGGGTILYEVNIPDGIDVSSLTSVEILFEGAARAGLAKVDARMADFPWSRKKPTDTPQTDSTKWPTDVNVILNGQLIETVHFPDDPADARGILSHACGTDPGSYGYLTRVTVSGDKLSDTAASMRERRVLSLAFEVPENASDRGGFALYGDRMGRYAVDPTIVLATSRPIDLAAARASSKPVVAITPVDAVKPATRGGERWKYTLTDPGDGWNQLDFDDAGWGEGASGFGHDPGSLPSPQADRLRTEWNTSDIWLRKAFEVPHPVSLARLTFSHDEDVEVFLNGTPVLSRKDFITEYDDARLSADSLKAFRQGENVLAVHCRQTGGGQFIDVGLTYRCAPSQP